MKLKDRSNVAIKCLPDSLYRTQLEKLHNDFLSSLAALHKTWASMTNADDWVDADEPTIMGKIVTSQMLDEMEAVFINAGIES